MGIAKKCTKNDTITGIFNKCPFLGSGPDRGRSPVEWGKRERERKREREKEREREREKERETEREREYH